MERLNIEVLQNAINSLDIMQDEQTPLDKVTIQALREYKELRDLEEQGLLLRTGDCAGCRYEKDSEICGVCGRAYSDAYETAESAIAEQENKE